jgi:hypothetical protein
MNGTCVLAVGQQLPGVTLRAETVGLLTCAETVGVWDGSGSRELRLRSF